MMRILTNVFYAGLLVVWPLVALGVWSRLWPDEAAFAVLLLIFIVERYVAVIAYFFGYRFDLVRRPNA
jgi:hypothetical protein